MGPTASGKTALATHLFDHLSCELVSVDAVQVYRGMDVGTAKPDKAFLARYPHHLIDIRDPDCTYDAARFCEDAGRLVGEILGRGRLPVLVGGTMFYFSALERGLSRLPGSSDALRGSLVQRHEGAAALHEELAQRDPVLARGIRPSDTQRILRGLEMLAQHPEPPSLAMARGRRKPLGTPLVKIGLFLSDRGRLHALIRERFEQMLANGLVQEVVTLAARLEAPQDCPAMRSVGYRQALSHARGEYDEAVLLEKGVAATRQLAKRQLTWLRNQGGVTWLDGLDPRATEALLEFVRHHPHLRNSGHA